MQQTVLRSLVGRASFRPGTNFVGWLFRIQRNEFISGLRRERPTVELTDAIAGTLSQPQRQESGIVMREFMTAFRTLAGDQRRALLLTALDGRSHESIAAVCGVAIGTVKSRVSRARAQLRQMARPRDGRLHRGRAGSLTATLPQALARDVGRRSVPAHEGATRAHPPPQPRVAAVVARHSLCFME